MPWRSLELLVALSLGVIAVLFAADLCAVERARPFLIGALNTSWGPTPQVVGLRDGLRQLGYRENEDFVIGVRFTQGDLTALPAAARQLVQDGVDIIFVDHDDGAEPPNRRPRRFPSSASRWAILSGGLIEASPGLVAISLGWRISTLS